MSVSRPIETVVRDTISAALPLGNVGNFDINTGGASLAVFEVEAVDTTPIVKVYVKSSASGTWRKWRSWQKAVASDVATLKILDSEITLVVGDQIWVPCAGFYAVRLAYVSGTSATIVGRTTDGDDIAAHAAGMGAEGMSLGTPNETTPSFPTATSTTLAAANPSRRYLEIQNNSSANIMVSLEGNTLTDIVPSATNIGIVIAAGGSYWNPSHYCPTGAITGYQTSGATIRTVVVVEG